MLLQEGVSSHDEAWGAVTTLGGTFLGESLLDRVELAGLGQTLDGDQVAPVGLGSKHTASVNGFVIEQHTTAAAITRSTNKLCAFEVMGVQGFEQRITRLNAPFYVTSVEFECNIDLRHDAIPLP